MAACDDYKELKTQDKNDLFEEIFKLKAEKLALDKRIKELEGEYKPMLEGLMNDVFFVTNQGTKFSIKKSTRTGSVDTKSMVADGIDVESYRKKPTTIYTLRQDK